MERGRVNVYWFMLVAGKVIALGEILAHTSASLNHWPDPSYERTSPGALEA
jgi:hypothetical protein